MRSQVFILALCVTIWAPLQGQAQSEVQKRRPFVVSACVHGATLKTTRSDTSGVSVDTFRLRGFRHINPSCAH